MSGTSACNDIVSFFARFIESELGIIYSEENYFQLQNRLEEIARTLDLADLNALMDAAKKQGINGNFKQLLIDKATNNETSFFRDMKAFQAAEQLMRNLLAGNEAKQPLRIWSAASSTGQEALSLAMLFEDLVSNGEKNAGLSILATDISSKVLEKAKSGTYSDLEVSRGLSEKQLDRYFKPTENKQWVASTKLMSHITFREMNLKSPFSFPDKFDIVLCRNVLIYQKPESKCEILKRITASIVDGGYLILGSGESLIGLSKDFEQESLCGAIVYRKKGV